MIGYVNKAIDYFGDSKPKKAQSVPASLFFREEGLGLFSLDKSGKVLNHLPFNLFISEDHELNFRVSEHPLQDGSTVTDHVHREPYKVTVEGMFTNHPLKKLEEVDEFKFKDEYATSEVKSTLSNTALANFEKVKELAKKREPVRLVCSLEVYPKMIVTSIKAQRDSKSGSSIRFTMTLQEIKTVSLKTVTMSYSFQPEDMVTANDKMIAAEMKLGKRTPTEIKADQLKKIFGFESASSSF